MTGIERGLPFNFLGFTHICAQTRKTKSFVVVRKTMRTKMQAKLQDLKRDLRTRLHAPVPEVALWLSSVVKEHYAYYGVPFNGKALPLTRVVPMRHWGYDNATGDRLAN